MTTLVEQFVASLKWDVPASEQRKLEQFEKSLDRTIGGFTKLAKVAAAAGAALFGAMTIVNQKTAENKRLAESIGVTIEEFEAWGDVMDDVGLSGDKVTRMMLDFNKNIGELKGTGLKSLEDSLKMVGLRLKDIEDLSPRDQFMAFMDAAKGTEDVQLAIGAASKLLGRQGKFIIPYLHDLDGSMQDILDRALGVVQLTTEGAEGAEQWARAMDTIKTASSTLMKQFLGLLGGALSPMLDKLADWIVANKALIQERVKEWVDRVATAIKWLTPKLVWLITKIGDLIGDIDDLAESMGGWKNVMKLIGAYLTGAVFAKGILAIGRMAAAWRALGAAALFAQIKMLLLPIAIAAIPLAFEDFHGFLTGKDSVTEDLLRLSGYNDEQIEAIRQSWLGFGKWIEGWGDGFVETMWAFWKEVGDFFHDLVVQRIIDGVEKIKKALFSLPLAELMGGNTTRGSTEGGRAAAYKFGAPPPSLATVMGGKSAAQWQAEARSLGRTTNVEAPITINTTGGNPEQIGRAVAKYVGQEVSKAKRANSTGVER